MMGYEAREMLQKSESEMAMALAKTKGFTRMMKKLPSWKGQNIEDWAAEAAKSICYDMKNNQFKEYLKSDSHLTFVHYLSNWFANSLVLDGCWEENIKDKEARYKKAKIKAIGLVVKWF